jgi:hypothetical protein
VGFPNLLCGHIYHPRNHAHGVPVSVQSGGALVEKYDVCPSIKLDLKDKDVIVQTGLQKTPEYKHEPRRRNNWRSEETR